MKIKQTIIAKLDGKFREKRWYRPLRTDRVFRALFFCAIGTVFTVAFALYNGLMGIFHSSVWHGAFSAYLLVLAIQRLIVIAVYRSVSKKFRGNEEGLEGEKLKIYLANGVIFIPVAVALSVIIALLVSSRKPVVDDEILAITTAAYAFSKITVAIVNFIRARTMKDPVVQTIRNTCLMDAIVSVILLESTLITTFGELTHGMDILIAISGLIGCGFALALGVYMMTTAIRRRSKISEENNSTGEE